MFYTQLQAARQGLITPQMKVVAEKEQMSVEALRELVAKGHVVIPCNKNHTSINPEGIGKALRTKINVNLGTSKDCMDYQVEMEKVNQAIAWGAESIMDLSTHGDTAIFRRMLGKECTTMVGTVPIYDSVIHHQKDLAFLTHEDFLSTIRLHAEDGVDFITIHCGITRKTIQQIKEVGRKLNIVSRGGSLVFAWMSMTGKENPFYEYFDDILDICAEYDVTISLGDACRPGCLADATDICQIEELIRLGELVRRARQRGVQVMIEGPGHVPLNQIQANMEIEQTLCEGAPFYVLGPLVTDIAPGYDHITAAIGGAVAGMHGASFLCYVTPAEHLALPNVDDVKEGIMAFKIAAHAADIAKGIPRARDRDDRMAEARQRLDWEAQYSCAMDPEKARAIRESRAPGSEHSETCSMCGKFCAVRSINKALAEDYIDII
ncbi:phosphomethylpyrimidine synthase ThiC [Veillonella agrestimuris]|uniref:phosphomethylpyrimidine synthase ThiC n=1 Tax=Veillonella agrestimuris TaxID=2941340 RepID=UPI00203B1C1C|nr:phosphomethylpyrimidine synthase ThiC [Veillonella agrestimuris]